MTVCIDLTATILYITCDWIMTLILEVWVGVGSWCISGGTMGQKLIGVIMFRISNVYRCLACGREQSGIEHRRSSPIYEFLYFSVFIEVETSNKWRKGCVLYLLDCRFLSTFPLALQAVYNLCLTHFVGDIGVGNEGPGFTGGITLTYRPDWASIYRNEQQAINEEFCNQQLITI